MVAGETNAVAAAVCWPVASSTHHCITCHECSDVPSYLLVLVDQGILNCGQTIIQEEGTRALWKGLTPFATHLTLKYALRMGSNSVYQNLLRDQVGACVRSQTWQGCTSKEFSGGMACRVDPAQYCVQHHWVPR